ncbi:hypothetical protein F4693_003681 [Sphingomonas endophytica]|jgi:hypothetical protein|uniref:Lipoprotein n=1 Tax=Sphingomonas endophytica TaxID=869719 RepID=A0A7X0JG58_9SPHN|nr:hypothetical protein [Sphingomonas endophytica]MBB6506670.1 hypothetical protein [Sphingomonas endophytica]
MFMNRLIRPALVAISPFLLVACAREIPLGKPEISGTTALEIAQADVLKNLVSYAGYSETEANKFTCKRYCSLQNQWWALFFKPLMEEVPNRFIVKVGRFQVAKKPAIQEYIYIGSYGTITDHVPW